MKTDFFQSCGHCWVFQICRHIECSTFAASYFRIWNISAGIPSSPLALFIVMLPEAHFTLNFKMSGSRWVITASWISGSWRSFLYSSPVFSCHLFLIFLLLLGPYHFCPLLCPSLCEMFPCDVAQLCSTLCDPMNCSFPCYSIHGIFQATGVSCHFLLQGIVSTQGLNPGLLHCRQTLYCLSHQGSPTFSWYL